MVAKALEAAEELAKEGINVEVVNISTIKPLDEALIKETAKKTGKVVTAEEHSIQSHIHFLIHNLDSQFLGIHRRPYLHLFSIQQNFSGIRGVCPCQHLHQS